MDATFIRFCFKVYTLAPYFESSTTQKCYKKVAERVRGENLYCAEGQIVEGYRTSPYATSLLVRDELDRKGEGKDKQKKGKVSAGFKGPGVYTDAGNFTLDELDKDDKQPISKVKKN